METTTETSLRVARCLEGLAPPIRLALLLRYQEGFSYEEMGEMCRERPVTLQRRVVRAMLVLRRCLESDRACD